VTRFSGHAFFLCRPLAPAYLRDRCHGPGLCPVAEHIAANALSFVVKPFYSPQDADETILGIRKVLDHYRLT
jgi:dTDP-4-amino-4,6-dideoxygalactose transaminase